MALRTANATGNQSASIWEAHIGTSTSISNATVASITSAGLFTDTFTAPNTTNAITGCWICISTLPTNGGNIAVTLQESSVDTACTTSANAATLKLGWNYYRFPTPYVFTTTGAGAYRFKVSNSVGTSGQLRVRVGTTPGFTATYDSVSTHGSTDDLWVGGHITASAVSAITVTATGTSNTFGSGTDTNITATSNISTNFGLALTAGNGGTYKIDTTASATAQMRGTSMPFKGGTIDLRSNTSNKAIITTFKIDNNTTAGQFGLHQPPNGSGDYLTDGADYSVYTTFVSGLGTAASPAIFSTAVDWDVNDEIVIGTTGGYLQNEKRYIKTRNSSTSFVLSNTPGGAEAALSFTHTNAHVANLTKNCIITAETSTRGYFIYLQGTTNSYLKNTRFEYVSNSSGKGVITLQPTATNFDGSVFYGTNSSTRGVLSFQSVTSGTVTGVVTYGTTAINLANGAIQTQTSSNINFIDCFGFGDGGALGGCHFAFNTNSVNIQTSNCWSYGANSSNTATSAAFYYSSSFNCGGDSSGIQGCRLYGIAVNNAPGLKFTNSDFGSVSASGTSEIFTVSSTFNSDVLFEGCNFSATPISNYLNQLDGSDIAFQDYGENTSSHRWYTNKGSFWSSGSGLTDTTVRTSSSLALAIKPENSTNGAEMYFKVPANPTSNVQIYGYMYRNATFSSGDITVDLFLPGTLLTDTPDATTTLATTTGAWQIWSLNAYNSGSVARYATVRIRAKTATAGAYVFLDDIYDATTNNKVAGMDLWDEGHISPIMLALDLSAVPEQTRVAVWSDNSTYSAGQKGHHLTQKLLTVAKFLGLK